MVNSAGVNSPDELWVPAREPSKVPSTTSQQQDDLSSDGYIVIREILTPGQVERLRHEPQLMQLHYRSSRRYQSLGRVKTLSLSAPAF